MGNECIVLDDDIEVVYCQDISLPGAKMPAMVTFFILWVDSDGIHSNNLSFNLSTAII